MEPLLEREAELALLAAALDGAREGHGQMVLVSGEAGIGKTSLLRELRRRVRDDAGAFLVGACEPLSVPVPLGPLRELAAAAGVGDLSEFEGADRLALARVLLGALTAHEPAVVVVEDAHWADPGTLDVLRLFARRVEDVAAVIVVTYRGDELRANPALEMLVGDLATSPAVRRISLRPLSAAAVRTLAEPAGVDASELSRLTGGNPFLVVEALASGGGEPASVRDATLARVARLGPSARRIVEVAAVIGQRVPPALLAAVMPDGAGAVEEALARGVLTDDGDALGFRHELTRQAIERAISAPRRAELHARVMSALAESGHAAGHARLAHHAELAGLPAEASRYARLAADEAERLGALSEVTSQLERALRVGPTLSDRERFELLLRYARAANFSSRMEEALEGAEQAVALAEAMNDRQREGRARAVLAWALWSLDRLAEARSSAERAVELLEQAGGVEELARAHAGRIRMEATAFDSAVAIQLAPRALELAAAADLEEVRVDVMISVGLARGHRGDRSAGAMLADAVSAARAAGLAIQTIRAYVNSVAVAADERAHGTVDAVSAEALALFDEYQTAIPRDVVLIYVARSLLDRGRWEEALHSARLGRRTWHGEVALARAVEGVVRLRRGDEDGQALLDRARSEVAEVPEGSRHGIIRVALAEAAWLRGDRRAGLEHAVGDRSAPHSDQFARQAGDVALWAARCGGPSEPPEGAPEAVLLELAGDWRGAIRAWEALEAPYEAALAALPGDDRAARGAMAALRQLGAQAAARAFARERAAAGARAPRGPRRSTLANAAGLTRREQQVLDQLATGATNAAIAGTLQLSERTVAHHVSAILGKLGASTRTAAVDAARRAGLLAQDGQVREPR